MAHDESTDVASASWHPLLEADAANYDDWNELFAEPLRMAECLRLEDGTR